jgi:hypothetical protein
MDYFDDQIAQGKPIVPPTAEQAPLPPQTQPVTPTEFKGLPVRAGGDRVFLLLNGKKQWFANAEAFAKAGFKFGDEVKIDDATLNVIPEGEPIR